MSWLGVRLRLRACMAGALPGLRVIGMAYTALVGVVAVVLVALVAFLPVTPGLQQATQPAREAVGSIVAPATNAVASLAGLRTALPETAFQLVPVPHVALASTVTAPATPDVLAGESSVAVAIEAADADVAAPRPTTRFFAASPAVALAPVIENSDVAAEDVPLEEPEQAVDATIRASVQQVVLAEIPSQQAADVEAPKPLAVRPTATETGTQTKARLDVENQAAIDAARASVARLKAESDAANQAAIDARKTATAPAARVLLPPTVVAPPAVADVVRATPAEAARASAEPQTRAAANAANQAQIGAAKAAAAHGKAEANAANQAAIDAARAPRKAAPSATAPPMPTPAPTAWPTAPTPTVEPTPTNAGPTFGPEAVVDAAPIEQDEAPNMLALDAP